MRLRLPIICQARVWGRVEISDSLVCAWLGKGDRFLRQLGPEGIGRPCMTGLELRTAQASMYLNQLCMAGESFFVNHSVAPTQIFPRSFKSLLKRTNVVRDPLLYQYCLNLTTHQVLSFISKDLDAIGSSPPTFKLYFLLPLF